MTSRPLSEILVEEAAYASAVNAVIAAAKDVNLMNGMLGIYRQYVPIGLWPLMDAVSRLLAIEKAAQARQAEERKQRETA